MSAIVDTPSDSAKSWLSHGVALGVVILLIVVEFHRALYAALQVWRISPTYSHCFLIIPIVGWLIWEKRVTLQTLRPTVAPLFLWLLPPLVLVWWLGELSAINELRQFAIIALIQITIISLLGVAVFRVIWFPVLFLLFLVPTGEYLIYPLQRFTTHFVDTSLNVLNIPHYTEGTTFELTNGRFEIAEACAGLRFLIATVTLGVLFSYLMYRKIYKVALFLFLSAAVPLIGNGLRCVGIILLAHYTNNKYGAGADHIVYGWGFNVAILLVLMFVGSLFRDDMQAPTAISQQAADQNTPAALVMVMAAAAIIISCGPAFAWWRDASVIQSDITIITSFLHADGWKESNPSNNWQPYFPSADAQTMMSWAPNNATRPVDLFIGYYAQPRAGRTMTAHLNKAWNDRLWNPSSATMTNATLGKNPIQLQETIIDSGFEKRLVWTSYWVDGRFTSSVLIVKLLQAKAALGGHEGQAFVALSTIVDGPVIDARARLTRAFASLGPLPSALDRAAVPAAVAHDRGR